MTTRILAIACLLAVGCGPAAPQGKSPPVILNAQPEPAGPPAWQVRVELARKRELLNADIAEIQRRLLAVDEEIEVLGRDLLKFTKRVSDTLEPKDPVEKAPEPKAASEKAQSGATSGTPPVRSLPDDRKESEPLGHNTPEAKAPEPTPGPMGPPPGPPKDEVIERLTAETADLTWRRDKLAERYLERRQMLRSLRQRLADVPG